MSSSANCSICFRVVAIDFEKKCCGNGAPASSRAGLVSSTFLGMHASPNLPAGTQAHRLAQNIFLITLSPIHCSQGIARILFRLNSFLGVPRHVHLQFWLSN